MTVQKIKELTGLDVDPKTARYVSDVIRAKPYSEQREAARDAEYVRELVLEERAILQENRDWQEKNR